MAKLSSSRIYGNLIIDNDINIGGRLSISEGDINISGGAAGEFLKHDGT
jgi:hypothetical protein